MENNTNVQHSILQYLMMSGCVPCNELMNVLHSYPNHSTDTSQELDAIINDINESISRFCHLIRKVTCDNTGNEFYIFMNTVADNISKIQREFKERDLEFVKLIIDEIIHNEQHSVQTVICEKLFSKFHGTSNFTQARAQKLIEQLIWKGYIHQQGDHLSLGVRCIYECEPYLREVYGNSLIECFLCKEIVLTGENCRNCDMKVHTHCINKFKTPQRKCPICREHWSGTEDNESNKPSAKRQRL